MRDPVAEREHAEVAIKDVEVLVKVWQQYYALLLAAFEKDRDLPADAQSNFDMIKREIAMRHDQFSSVITKDHYVAQNVLQMVKRTINIVDFRTASEVAVDKTLIEWHDANILLHETLGSLQWQIIDLTENEEEIREEIQRRARAERNAVLMGHLKKVGNVLSFFGMMALMGAAAYYIYLEWTKSSGGG